MNLGKASTETNSIIKQKKANGDPIHVVATPSQEEAKYKWNKIEPNTFPIRYKYLKSYYPSIYSIYIYIFFFISVIPKFISQYTHFQ